MARITVAELRPCVCGSRLLSMSMPVTVRTPKIVRLIRTFHGVTCVRCGNHAATRKQWNRRAEDADRR